MQLCIYYIHCSVFIVFILLKSFDTDELLILSNMKNLMFVKVDQGVELHPLISVHQYYYTFCYTKGITFNVHPYTPFQTKTI